MGVLLAKDKLTKIQIYLNCQFEYLTAGNERGLPFIRINFINF